MFSGAHPKHTATGSREYTSGYGVESIRTSIDTLNYVTSGYGGDTPTVIHASPDYLG